MIEQFEAWICQIETEAIAWKRSESIKNYDGNDSNWKKYIWTSPTKNKQIKARFVAEAEGKYEARASGPVGKREWLYDLVWRQLGEDGKFVKLVLAMEIELSDWRWHGLIYDFNKLLQSDAEYKIFVFQQKTDAECLGFFEHIESAWKAYRGSGKGQYLLAGWCTRKNAFLFKRLGC